MQFRVTADWQASYANPILLRAGDALFLSDRQERWDGHLWIWARSADGLEGWIPDSLARPGAGGHVATSDYTAMELTCRAGQILTGEQETHGWIFCTAQDGTAGWVPRQNLATITA